ncbi:hypothetical protein D3C76_853530 [compost metagenome]
MVANPLALHLLHLAANHPALPCGYDYQVPNPCLSIGLHPNAKQPGSNGLGLGQHPEVIPQPVLPALPDRLYLILGGIHMPGTHIAIQAGYPLLQRRVLVKVVYGFLGQRDHAVVSHDHHRRFPRQGF